jgi:NADPH2:quinone reductase
MRAWQVTKAGEPRDVLTLADAPPPSPLPGMLQVRVGACGIGLPDLLMCRARYALTPQRPFTPGQELAGTVTNPGPEASFSVGDRVMAVSGFVTGAGGFAELALAIAEFCFVVPDSMSDEQAAAFLIPFHTAYVGLVTRAVLTPGETLLVLGGSGGTGSAAIQLGRALGARVLATAGGPEKVAFCRSLGAEAVADHHSEDIAERVDAWTDGRGADVVYDPVGGTAFEAATKCIAHEGRLLLVGFAGGAWGQPSPAHMVSHNYSVLGVMPSGYDRAYKLRAQGVLVDYFERGDLRVPLHEAYAFERLPDALETLAGGGCMGKLVLRGPA